MKSFLSKPRLKVLIGALCSLLSVIAETDSVAASLQVQQPSTAGGYDSTGTFTSGTTNSSGSNQAGYVQTTGASTSSGPGAQTDIYVLNDSTYNNALDLGRQGLNYLFSSQSICAATFDTGLGACTASGSRTPNAWYETKAYGSRNTWQTPEQDSSGLLFRLKNTNSTYSVTFRISFDVDAQTDDTALIQIKEDGAAGTNWENVHGWNVTSSYITKSGTCGSCNIGGGTFTYLVTLNPGQIKTVALSGGVWNGSGVDALKVSNKSIQAINLAAGTDVAIVDGTF